MALVLLSPLLPNYFHAPLLHEEQVIVLLDKSSISKRRYLEYVTKINIT